MNSEFSATPIHLENTTDIVGSIERALAELLQLYQRYAQCLTQDQDLMARLKIDEIEKNNKLKNTLLLKIQAMDNARQGFVKKYAKENNLASESIRLIDLCKTLHKDQSDRLLNIREQLQQTILQLKKLQTETSLLANTSLGWINSSLAKLKGLLAPTGIYNPQGKVDHPSVFSGRVVEKQA